MNDRICQISLAEIETAYQAMQEHIHATPLDRSRTFSEMANCEVYLKLENLQKTGSFKLRGAYNKIRSLTPAERACGVIAASAGNHAQGVAYAARLAATKATIVMPETAPLAKITATRDYQAEVVLSGLGYDDAYEKACQLQQASGQVFIHAFNDPAVIAGQGTIGIEIIKNLPDVAAVVVPIGGGGLAAGVAMAIKELAPHVAVYGVQAQGAAAMYLSKQSHLLQSTPQAMTIADGIAVRAPGDLTFALIERYVDDIVTVDDEAIAGTILMLLERAKMMVEGAGAISLAALLHHLLPVSGKVVSLVSGGNIDVNFISRIIERGLVKTGRRIKITTLISDQPGALNRLLGIIAELRANVLQIYHDRVERNVPLGKSVVEISIETQNTQHGEQVLAALRAQQYVVEQL